MAYYSALRAALRAHPDVRRCRVRCAQCGIFFLLDPRNLHLAAPRCPFGCRQEHRRRSSVRRSVAYYQTLSGWEKKSQRNEKRDRRKPAATTAPAVAEEQSEPAAKEAAVDVVMLSHLRGSTGLIERRVVGRGEVLALLRRIGRQLSMATGRRMDYVVKRLHEARPDG